MTKYDRTAFQLEKFIHERLPLKAKPREGLRANDTNLADNFEKDETKEFDGVVYFPKTKEVYCSFYDKIKKVAVLVPVADLIYENPEVQKQIENFRKFKHASKREKHV
jgi:hypothetical protein